MNFVLPPYGRKESFNLVKEIIASDEYNEPVIVEIGMTRTAGNWLGDGYSTPFFAYLVNVCLGELYSIDIDPDVRNTCKSILNEYGLDTDRVHLIVEDGISFFERWHGNMKKKIDLLYLDGWDYSEGHKAIISEEAHLKAFQTIENELSSKALVLIDDVYDTVTFKGKGRLVIPYLLQKDYKPLYLDYQCLFSKHTFDSKYYKSSLSFSSANKDPLVDELVHQACEESIKEGKEGAVNLPGNLGDILLQNESHDVNIKTVLSKKREDGVREDDIRWWWNMDDIQRRVTIKLTAKSRQDKFQNLTELYGLPEYEANLIIKKTTPVFGEPDESHGTAGEDRPLPYELMWRINNYIQTLQTDPNNYKNTLKSSSSFNAFIRREIRKGKL
jgi:hypothetical protein